MTADEEDPVPTGYDPELPFFIKHRELVRQQAERELARQTRTDRRRQRRPVLSRATFTRPARRAISLTAVLTLIGASAYALTSGRHNATPSTSPTQFASDTAGSDSWTLSAWQRAGELCRDIAVNDVVQSDCALPPRGRQVQTLTVDSATRRYVFGLTTARQVTVRVGGSHHTVSTQAPSSASDSAGLPADTRWFVTSFARGRRPHAIRVSARGR